MSRSKNQRDSPDLDNLNKFMAIQIGQENAGRSYRRD